MRFLLFSRGSSGVMFDIYDFVDVKTVEKTNFPRLFRDFHNEFLLNRRRKKIKAKQRSRRLSKNTTEGKVSSQAEKNQVK